MAAILWIAVRRDAQGSGVGTALVNQLLAARLILSSQFSNDSGISHRRPSIVRNRCRN
jgi:GNAT superfamily N-acetyltransferase